MNDRNFKNEKNSNVLKEENHSWKNSMTTQNTREENLKHIGVNEEEKKPVRLKQYLKHKEIKVSI